MYVILFQYAMAGSSPHGRGTHSGERKRAHRSRFIPARAGNTSHRHWHRSSHPVHPRTGGEHARNFLQHHSASGSSPHGRGTPHCAMSCVRVIRFIPARAGNTRGGGSGLQSGSVHPRTGGEHVVLTRGIVPKDGSSPHGRGTHLVKVRSDIKQRFIPARAGNTPRNRMTPASRSVHPRTGGEHIIEFESLTVWTGSSPHGRGTRHATEIEVLPHRFIPARAGNTKPSATWRKCSAVHPRTGGEH